MLLYTVPCCYMLMSSKFVRNFSRLIMEGGFCWLACHHVFINTLLVSKSFYQIVIHSYIFIFVALCAERLTQMTKTYNDIEAVTRLLEEVIRHLVVFRIHIALV